MLRSWDIILWPMETHYRVLRSRLTRTIGQGYGGAKCRMVLPFENELFPIDSCVECLVSSWWYCFGRWWKIWGGAYLEEVGHRVHTFISVSLQVYFSPLALCFLSAIWWLASNTCLYFHDVLPHCEPRINRAKDYGLKPLQMWAKINHSSP
jgi:hypothetical protein